MTRDFLEFEQGDDTGDDNPESIAPIEAGDPGNPQSANRPLDVLRLRTEVLRAALDDALFLAAEDRSLGISCPGGLYWGGPYDIANVGTAEDSIPGYTGRIGIGGDLSILSLITPNATAFSTIQIQSALNLTTRKTAADGGRQVSIEIVDDSALSFVVSGTPVRHLTINVDAGVTDAAAVETALLDPTNAEAAALIYPSVEAGQGAVVITVMPKVTLTPGWDYELHTIKKGTFDAFFNVDLNRLQEGDNLCLRFKDLATRRQHLNDGTPPDGIAVSPVSDPDVTEVALTIGRADTEHLQHAIPIAKVSGGNLVLLNGNALRPGAFWLQEAAEFSSTVQHTAREVHVRTVEVSGFKVAGGAVPNRVVLRDVLNDARKRALKGNVSIVSGGAYYVEGQHFIVDAYRDTILQLATFAEADATLYFRELPDTAENLGTNRATGGPPAALMALDTRFFERHPDRNLMVDVQSGFERMLITAVTIAEAAALSERIRQILGTYYLPVDTGIPVPDKGSLSGMRLMQGSTSSEIQEWRNHASTKANLWQLGGKIAQRFLLDQDQGEVIDQASFATEAKYGASFTLPSDLDAVVQEYGDNWNNVGDPGAADLALQIAAIQFGDAIRNNPLKGGTAGGEFLWRAVVQNAGVAVGLTELRDYPMAVTVGPARTYGVANATHVGTDAATLSAACATAISRGQGKIQLLPGEYAIDAEVDGEGIEFVGIGAGTQRPVLIFDEADLSAVNFPNGYCIRGARFESVNFAFKGTAVAVPIFEPADNTVKTCIVVSNEVRRSTFTSYPLRASLGVPKALDSLVTADRVKFTQISAIAGSHHNGATGQMRTDDLGSRLHPRMVDCAAVGMFMSVPNYEGSPQISAPDPSNKTVSPPSWETKYYAQALFGGQVYPTWGSTTDVAFIPLDIEHCAFFKCGITLDLTDYAGAPFSVDLDTNTSVMGLAMLLLARRVHCCVFSDTELFNDATTIVDAGQPSNGFPMHGGLGIMASEITNCIGVGQGDYATWVDTAGGITIAADDMQHIGVTMQDMGTPIVNHWALCAAFNNNRFNVAYSVDSDTPLGVSFPEISIAHLDVGCRILDLERPAPNTGDNDAQYSGVQGINNEVVFMSASNISTANTFKSEAMFSVGSLWLDRFGHNPAARGAGPLAFIQIRGNQFKGINPSFVDSSGDQTYLVLPSIPNLWNQAAGGDGSSWACHGDITGNTGQNVQQLGLGEHSYNSGDPNPNIMASDNKAILSVGNFELPFPQKVVVVTAGPYSVPHAMHNYVFLCDPTTAGFQMDLPTSPRVGETYIFVALAGGALASNIITLDGNGNIFQPTGSSTLRLGRQGDVATVVFDGTDWQVLATSLPFPAIKIGINTLLDYSHQYRKILVASDGGKTLTLPAAPLDGMWYEIATDADNTLTNPRITIVGNGKVIVGYGASMVSRQTNAAAAKIIYSTSESAWQVIHQTGFDTLSESSNKTLDATHEGKTVLVDTDGGDCTITLPATPPDGYRVKLVVDNDAVNENKLTIAGNGKSVGADASSLTTRSSDAGVELIYNSTGNTWVIESIYGFPRHYEYHTATSPTLNHTEDGGAFVVDVTAGPLSVTLPVPGSSEYGTTYEIIRTDATATGNKLTIDSGVGGLIAYGGSNNRYLHSVDAANDYSSIRIVRGQDPGATTIWFVVAAEGAWVVGA